MRDIYKLINSYYTKEAYEYDNLEKLEKDALLHQVYPFLYLVLKKNEYKKYLVKAMQYDNRFNELENIISTTLDGLNIQYIYIKGMAIKKIYEYSYLRTMGDIDVLVRPSDYLKAIKAFEVLGYYYDKDSLCEHHIAFTKGEVEFELHQYLFDTFDNRYKFFQNPFDHLDGDMLEHEYEICYLLCHLEKHILHGGAGLRHLVDFYLYHTKYDIDENKLNNYLNELDLKCFYNNIMALSRYIMDFSYKISDTQEALLEFLYSSGSHGAEHDEALYTYASKSKSKLGYLMSKAFPSTKSMIALYPILRKHVILFPVCRVRRIFSLLKKKNKAKKVIYYNKKDVNNIREFYKKIGL